jgi:hypothetical protein
MAALVTVEDFATFMRVPVPSGDKRTQMEFLLTLTSDWARELSAKPWLLPVDAPTTARGIILAACRREWNNPKRVLNVTKGPQAATFMTQSYPTGFFTEAEEARLKAYRRSGGDLWTQDTYRDELPELNGYLEVEPQGGLMPVYSPYDPFGYPGSIHP